MNKILKEEIERFQLLSKYDNKKTLTENSKLSDNLNEQINLLGKLFGREAGALSKTTIKEIENLFKSIPSEMARFGTDAAEIATKLKSGAFTKTELGELRTTVFKNTTNTKVQNEIADEMVKSKSFKDFFTSNKEKKVLEKLMQKGYSGEEAAIIMSRYEKQGGKYLDDIYRSKNVQRNTKKSKKQRANDNSWGWSKNQKNTASSTAWNIVKGIGGTVGFVFKNFWNILWGAGGLIVAYYVWKYLTQEKKTGYPDCLGKNMPLEDFKEMFNQKRDHILNTDTGNDFIDENGGGKFYQNGSFETENGKYKGGWKEDDDLGVVVTLQNGDEYVISCEGTQDWGDEEMKKDTEIQSPEKIEKQRIISNWNGNYTECDDFPMELGCKNDGVIGTIQICLGLPKDGKFSPKVLDALEKKGYGYTLSYDIYKRIQSECGMGETESGFASYI